MDFQDWLFSKYSDDAEKDVELLPEHIKHIMCVCIAHYPIGNGGFRYFFERDLPDNVSYKLIVESYRKVGLEEIADCFQAVLNIFPNSTPQVDTDERNKFLDIYFEHEDDEGNPIDTYQPIVEESESVYFREFENIPKVLQRYHEARGGEGIPSE